MPRVMLLSSQHFQKALRWLGFDLPTRPSSLQRLQGLPSEDFHVAGVDSEYVLKFFGHDSL